MPLVDLITDLKSLKYGKDTPGGGYSGQPYIQAKIPEGFTAKSPDFFLRNGFLAPFDALEDIKRLGKMFGDLKSPNGVLFIAKQNVLSNSAARTQTSGVLNEGIYTPLSTLAQAGVIAFGGHLNKQGIDPFEQTGAYATGDGLYNSVVRSSQPLENNRLAQILKGINENKTTSLKGFKFNEGGVNVLSYKGGPGAPLGVGNTNIRFTNVRTGEASGINFERFQVGTASSNTIRTDIPNYILNLSSSFAGMGLTIPLSSEGISPFTLNNQLIKNVIPEAQWRTYQASGYPLHDRLNLPSFLSSGSSTTYETLAKNAGVSANNAKVDNNFDFIQVSVYKQGNTWPEANNDLIYANNTFTYNQIDLINQSKTEGKLAGSPKTQDFRAILRKKLGEISSQGKKATSLGATPAALSYDVGKNQTIEGRTNLGDPGARSGKDYSSYTTGITYTGAVKALDKINALPIYRSELVKEDSEEYPVNDLVKFRIAAIDGTDPSFKTFIHFRAFLDSFSDSYTAEWTGNKYMGRGEDFYTYGGFGRTISLSFTVAAQSKQELIPMYQKLNYLASNLAPDYSPAGYMRGPLVQLTMGGYLYEQVGFITSLTYDIPNDTTFEIGINTAGESDSTVKELPHRINVSSFAFTPIHNFVPQKQGLTFTNGEGKVTGFGQQRYIALSNGSNTNWFPQDPNF